MEKNVYEDRSDSMEGVVVEVRVKAPCKRFANKGNGICNRSARGFDGHKANLHKFFFLRTIRVVTRISANSRRIPFGLQTIQDWPVRPERVEFGECFDLL